MHDNGHSLCMFGVQEKDWIDGNLAAATRWLEQAEEMADSGMYMSSCMYRSDTKSIATTTMTVLWSRGDGRLRCTVICTYCAPRHMHLQTYADQIEMHGCYCYFGCATTVCNYCIYICTRCAPRRRAEAGQGVCKGEPQTKHA